MTGTKHLRSIEELSAEGIRSLLDLTDHMAEINKRPIPKVPALRGKTVCNLFYEDSTRTRLSFETAAKRLSADVMTFSVGSSSVKKGESLRDTVETLEAMGLDAVVVRHSAAGVPWQLSQWMDASIVNAGDGWHEHPTQALLDCYTIRQESKKPFDELNIAIIGDIKHSRVARSNVAAFSKLGAKVTLVAPPTLLPPSLEGWPVTVSHQIDEVLATTDVAYCLRMQLERQEQALVPSLREYTTTYGLTGRRADRLPEGAIIMHPGPMNRGVEIDPDVADRTNSVIIDQVRNGVSVRMAVLYWLLGSGVTLGDSHE
jgi:aspartate carbamoyltransferase catalytic subunit